MVPKYLQFATSFTFKHINFASTPCTYIIKRNYNVKSREYNKKNTLGSNMKKVIKTQYKVAQTRNTTITTTRIDRVCSIWQRVA